jgi:predicted tellurium resistance membrane protein TerC
MHGLLTADGLVALLTLTAMEIVLGIDNIVLEPALPKEAPAARAAPSAMTIART